MAEAADVMSRGAVVYRLQAEAPRYLLLQYGARHWDFPKGHREPGESEEETTRRETEEETGIDDLVFLSGFRRTIRYQYRFRGQLVRKEVVFFAARTEKEPDAVQLSHEHIGFAWMDYEAALARLTFDNAREVLRLAHEHIVKQEGGTAVR